MNRRILIVTQKVNMDDPILGFFHRWIIEFAKHCESIVVICLEEGRHELPVNVKVLSLGKEKELKMENVKWKMGSRIMRTLRFYRYIWNERKNYDVVFVHMNQEYILLGGVLWKIFRKRIYMWRNHHSGSLLTDIAASFCINVFCTSKFSYTAKYVKTRFMPVGVDIDAFKPIATVSRIPQSVLSLGRISPSKHIDHLVDAIIRMNNSKIKLHIYGDPLPQDKKYYEVLKSKLGILGTFHAGIPNIETVAVYSSSDIFVNLSSSGMYDKTIFEAMVCGCLILASNDNLRGKISDDFIFKQGDIDEFVRKLGKLLNYSTEDRQRSSMQLISFAKKHSLNNLAVELFKHIV